MRSSKRQLRRTIATKKFVEGVEKAYCRKVTKVEITSFGTGFNMGWEACHKLEAKTHAPESTDKPCKKSYSIWHSNASCGITSAVNCIDCDCSCHNRTPKKVGAALSFNNPQWRKIAVAEPFLSCIEETKRYGLCKHGNKALKGGDCKPVGKQNGK
jgi:hypothetical protein